MAAFVWPTWLSWTSWRARNRRRAMASRQHNAFSWAGVRSGARTLRPKRPASAPRPIRTRPANSGSTELSRTCPSFRRLSRAPRAKPWCEDRPAGCGEKSAAFLRRLLLVGPEARENSRHAIVPFVARVFVDGSVDFVHGNLDRPRFCVNRRIVYGGLINDQIRGFPR